MIADDPTSDKGKNFGRLARTGIMDKYMADLFDEKLAGIPIIAWQKFLSIFTESRASDDITRSLDRVALTFASITGLNLTEEARLNYNINTGSADILAGSRS